MKRKLKGSEYIGREKEAFAMMTKILGVIDIDQNVLVEVEKILDEKIEDCRIMFLSIFENAFSEVYTIYKLPGLNHQVWLNYRNFGTTGLREQDLFSQYANDVMIDLKAFVKIFRGK